MQDSFGSILPCVLWRCQWWKHPCGTSTSWVCDYVCWQKLVGRNGGSCYLGILEISPCQTRFDQCFCSRSHGFVWNDRPGWLGACPLKRGSAGFESAWVARARKCATPHFGHRFKVQLRSLTQRDSRLQWGQKGCYWSGNHPRKPVQTTDVLTVGWWQGASGRRLD